MKAQDIKAGMTFLVEDAFREYENTAAKDAEVHEEWVTVYCTEGSLDLGIDEEVDVVFYVG